MWNFIVNFIKNIFFNDPEKLCLSHPKHKIIWSIQNISTTPKTKCQNNSNSYSKINVFCSKNNSRILNDPNQIRSNLHKQYSLH